LGSFLPFFGGFWTFDPPLRHSDQIFLFSGHISPESGQIWALSYHFPTDSGQIWALSYHFSVDSGHLIRCSDILTKFFCFLDIFTRNLDKFGLFFTIFRPILDIEKPALTFLTLSGSFSTSDPLFQLSGLYPAYCGQLNELASYFPRQ